MIGHVGGGGGTMSKCPKQFIIKTYYELILCKPVGKYQFTMACIKGFSYDGVPSNQLSYFSTKTYVDGSFKHEIIG